MLYAAYKSAHCAPCSKRIMLLLTINAKRRVQLSQRNRASLCLGLECFVRYSETMKKVQRSKRASLVYIIKTPSQGGFTQRPCPYVCLSVCLFVSLFVCSSFASATACSGSHQGCTTRFLPPPPRGEKLPPVIFILFNLLYFVLPHVW